MPIRFRGVYSDAAAAPLLCAGAVGYRSLRRTGLNDGDALALTGFGGSAHFVLRLARHLSAASPVHVFARDAEAQGSARELGAVWSGDTTDRSPQPLAAVIDTTPAWRPMVEAVVSLRPGGRLVVNAIRKEDDDEDRPLRLSYRDHRWREKEL